MFATDTFLPATGLPVLAYLSVAGITAIGGGITWGLTKIRGRRN